MWNKKILSDRKNGGMDMDKTISLSELKPGDIILFHKPKDSMISFLISLITLSPVSHSGMISSNPGYVIQEVLEGASRLPLGDPGERKLYIRRLQQEPDTSEVVKIAMKYVDEKLPYPFSNLIFLGMYILVSDFIPDTFEGGLVKKLLKLATYELMKLVNKKRHPGTDVPPMVCSQFVAACYDEAALNIGPEYKIHYNQKTSAGFLEKVLQQLDEEQDKSFTLEKPEEGMLLGASNSIGAAEDYCDQLVRHMQENTLLLARPSKVSDEVIAALYQYGTWLLKLLDDNTDFPDKDHATPEEIKNVLQELLRFQEAFITPGDLLSNTTNLMDMGLLTYTAEELARYLNENDPA